MANSTPGSGSVGGMGVAGTSATNRNGAVSQAPSRETSATVGSYRGADYPSSAVTRRISQPAEVLGNHIPAPIANNAGDRVIFAESPSAPGIPIVYRTPEERQANPDRLNLDRRRLTVCPILEGEEHLRLLNFQHNLISRIQHLASLKRLIFLDLYDNQIEEITGLNSLRSLRVLMLGKNKIKKIENLEALTKLDVLDLHGNQISKIERLNHLCELRVLNLAGNSIHLVENLSGLESLAELNLRRNKISAVTDVENLPCLQRLFLSFNEISSWEEICCLADSHSISELSLDGNPFAGDQFYKQTILRHMHQLRQLDMKRISEEERRIALVMARKEEEKKRQDNRIAIMKEKRRLAISNARRQWEVLQQQQSTLTGHAAATAAAAPGLPTFVTQYISPSGGTTAITSADAIHEGQESDSSDRPTSSDSASRHVGADLEGASGGVVVCSSSSGGGATITGAASGVISAAASLDTPTSGATSAGGKIAQGMQQQQQQQQQQQPQQQQHLRSIPSDSSSTISGNPTRASHSESSGAKNSTTSGQTSVSMTSDVQPVLLHSALNVCHLAELEGDCLNLYGSGSLDALDRNWGIQAAGAVITISFKFIEFDEIAKHLHKIRARFPNVQGLLFTETNIYCFQQINGFASLRRLDSLTIASEGNPVTEFSLWRPYAVFRLAHLQLKRLNDMPISQEDILNAERTFGPLATMTSQLPQSRLLSLLGESRKKFLLNLVTAANNNNNNSNNNSGSSSATGAAAGAAGGGVAGSGAAATEGADAAASTTTTTSTTTDSGVYSSTTSSSSSSAAATAASTTTTSAANFYADRLASTISGIGGGPGTAFTALQVLQSGNVGSSSSASFMSGAIGANSNNNNSSRSTTTTTGGSETVGRAGLAYVTQDGMARKMEDQETRRQFAKNYLLELSKEAVLVDRKKTQLQKAWNQIFLELVERAVLDLRSAMGPNQTNSTSAPHSQCGSWRK